MSISDDCWLYGHKQGDSQTRTSNTTVKDQILNPTTNKLIDAKPVTVVDHQPDRVHLRASLTAFTCA